MGQSCCSICWDSVLPCDRKEDEQPLIAKEIGVSFEAQQLSQAVVTGDYEAVQLLLSECTTISINEKDSTGCTALYKAVIHNHFNIAKLLLQLGASPHESTCDGDYPLHAAAACGSVHLCNLLIEHKANPNVFNSQNQSPLHIAVQENYPLVVKRLVELGADVNIHLQQVQQQQQQQQQQQYGVHNVGSSFSDIPRSPSASLTSSYSLKTFSLGKSHSLSPGPRSPARHSRNNSMTASSTHHQIILQPSPLMIACTSGYTDIVRFLIQSGASPLDDASENNGNTALMTCCENGHYSTVEFLLKYFSLLQGGDPSVLHLQVNAKSKSFHQWCSLHFAASSGHADICALLLESGANIDAADDIGRTPLHHACAKGYPDAVRLLITYGANTELRDDYNNYKNDPDHEGKEGKTAYDLCSESIHYHRVARAFREAVAARNNSGSSNSNGSSRSNSSSSDKSSEKNNIFAF